MLLAQDEKVRLQPIPFTFGHGDLGVWFLAVAFVLRFRLTGSNFIRSIFSHFSFVDRCFFLVCLYKTFSFKVSQHSWRRWISSD